MKVAVTAFTPGGLVLASHLTEALRARGHSCSLMVPKRLRGGPADYDSLGEWTKERFQDSEGLLFVGAAGIAVRAVGPWVRDKFTDPAVVSVDEAGRVAVPLLSGHVGGANVLARLVAELSGGIAAVSTATDVNGLFAVDAWAVEQGLFLDGREAAKHISAALLTGESVGVQSDFPIHGELPRGVVSGPARLGFSITLERKKAPFSETLRLIPPCLNVGIGCRRGTPMAAIAGSVERALRSRNLSPRSVRRICTIDLKAEEAGLLDFCRESGLPLITYSAEALRETLGSFTSSDFVREVTGVDNVCERAAVRAGGELIIPKQAGEGVTVAVSREPFSVIFKGVGA